MRNGLSIVLLLFLAACSSRPGLDVLNEVSASVPPGAKTVKIYVATTRARSEETGLFLNRRAEHLNFAEFTISVPPDHKPGMIEWPDGPADPSRTFATLRQRPLTQAEFEANTAPGILNRRAGVFTHGFNVSFQEGLFQAAQLSADADMKGTAVLFSWPSAASVTSYVADKDSVTASRDGFADTLTMLTRKRGPNETLLLAHSMGGWLTAETLRQLRLTGRGAVLDRLEVVLADPDVDTDVFRSQMAVIGRMKQPMTILVAPDDIALKVSSRLAADRKRVGAIDVHNPRLIEAARHYNIQVIDISAVDSRDSFNHGRFSQLAGRLSPAERSLGADQAGAFVLNSAGSILASPFTLAGRALSGE